MPNHGAYVGIINGTWSMLRNSIRIALATVAILAATPVAAETFIINLTADPTNLDTNMFSIGASNFRTGNVVVDAFTPLSAPVVASCAQTRSMTDLCAVNNCPSSDGAMATLPSVAVTVVGLGLVMVGGVTVATGGTKASNFQPMFPP